MKTILVTGARGQIGSDLIPILRQQSNFTRVIVDLLWTVVQCKWPRLSGVGT